MNEIRIEQLASSVVDAAYQVHKELGPGLLESAYQHCLAFELINRGITVEIEKALPLIYKDTKLDCGYRLDIVVEDCIILEIKSVDSLAPIHQAQLIT